MRNEPHQRERTIPLGTVFMAVGFILVLTVLAIWIIIPAKMPQPLYEIVSPYLQKNLPAPIQVAVVPTAVPTLTPDPSQALLPDTSLESDVLPDYFVSALDATLLEPQPGEPQRMVIPAINMDAAVTTVGLKAIQQNSEIFYQWQVPKSNKAGWHNSSALLGQPGNSVFNGHHNIFGEIFRDIVNLKEGDEIIMYDAFQSYTYRVTHTEIFEEHGQPIEARLENAKWIEATDDERITLITCWPYTDNSHRIIVVAEPVTDL